LVCLDNTDKQSYALSVRDFNEVAQEVTIKHYRIRKADAGGVYVSPRKIFSDLLDLVAHYQGRKSMVLAFPTHSIHFELAWNLSLFYGSLTYSSDENNSYLCKRTIYINAFVFIPDVAVKVIFKQVLLMGFV
jgi:hypothetical protein